MAVFIYPQKKEINLKVDIKEMSNSLYYFICNLQVFEQRS